MHKRIDGSDLNFYRVLSKANQDSAEGIIVALFLPTQIWYPAMLKMLVLTPILLNSMRSMLALPQSPNQVHPMWKKISILVVHLPGSLQKANECREMLLKSYQLCWEWEQGKGAIPIICILKSFKWMQFY